MQVKGTAVKSTKDFVRDAFPDRFDEWIEALPDKSREIYTSVLLASNWYPLQEALLIPSELVGKLFFDGDIAKAAFELGRDSALRALRGIYKIFVRIASIDFILKRVAEIFKTYYSEGVFEVLERQKNRVVFWVTGFQKGQELIYDRIAGWVEGSYRIISNKNFRVSFKIYEEEDEKINAKIIAVWEEG
jgi:hypothetical protein